MKNAQQQLLIACLAMLLGGNVFAADPPKDAPKADAKKEEKKDEAKKDEKKDDKKRRGQERRQGRQRAGQGRGARRTRSAVQALPEECNAQGFRAQDGAEEI